MKRSMLDNQNTELVPMDMDTHIYEYRTWKRSVKRNEDSGSELLYCCKRPCGPQLSKLTVQNSNKDMCC